MATVTVIGADVTVDLRVGESILGGLFRSGYAYRVGCRRGGCGVCKVDVVTGDVDHPATVSDTVLTAGERVAGAALSCRAVPLTDVVVRLRADRLRRIFPWVTAPADSTARRE